MESNVTVEGEEGISELDMLIERYLSFLALERRFSAHTIAAYRHDLADFSIRCQRAQLFLPQDIDRRFLRSYLASLRTLGFSRSSISRKAASLRSFFRYLHRLHILPVDPASTLRAPQVDHRLPRVPSQAVVTEMFSAFGPDALGMRDQALMALLYDAGLRVSEVASLNVEDLSSGIDWLSVWGKGGKARRVPIGEHLRKALDEYANVARSELLQSVGEALQARGGQISAEIDADSKNQAVALFFNMNGNRMTSRDIRRMVRKHGIYSPHDFRHACATHMLERGADIRSVQELLGHASLATTQTYTHVTGEILRRAHNASHPRA